MDLYGADRKLSELGDGEFEDFLDHDMFTPPTTEAMEHFGLDDGMNMNQEWLENFFDDPVLNDRMMTDALQPQNVQSEHSYSLANGDGAPLNLKVEATGKDGESELLTGAVNPNATLNQNEASDRKPVGCVKQEPESPGPGPQAHSSHLQQTYPVNLSHPSAALAPPAMKITRTVTQPQTILKQPTIILATGAGSASSLQQASQLAAAASAAERYVLPTVNIKLETQDDASNSSSSEHSMYDSIGLPPTPPSSSTSDSEGGQSPLRSAPSSPIRHASLARQHHHMQLSPYGRNSPSPTLSQPLFTSPIPTSGVLMLTEEEKRTLIAEGYPIPAKLPLTKQEEKNLKKIRRKIKNKISAQESRRKKKEYLETLEKRVESFSQENTDLKKKLDNLETNNRSLISQLQKLQNLVGKCRTSAANSTPTGTCLMVLVLFFAVFVGTWSPMSWSIGYGSMSSQGGAAGGVGQSGPASLVHLPPVGPAMGPGIQNPAVADPYETPSMKSRVLMSVRDESEDYFGPHPPFSYREFFLGWLAPTLACADSGAGGPQEADFTMTPPVPYVDSDTSMVDKLNVMTDVSSSASPRGDNDVTVNYTTQVMTSPVNATVA